jgi:AcrR family transcriptional regulator
MEATVFEMSETGFAGLTLEAVATRAGVNRTTIYRRWPTKLDLVRAAIASSDGLPFLKPPQDTGALRSDLLSLVRSIRTAPEKSKRRASILALLTESDDSQLASIVPVLRNKVLAPLPDILERAIQRGELPADIDRELIWRPLFATLNNEVLFGEPKEESFFTSLIDVLIAGVHAIKPAASETAPRRLTARRSR